MQREIENLINYAIMELNPELLDDDLPDANDDFDKRTEAIEYLIEKLVEAREEL